MSELSKLFIEIGSKFDPQGINETITAAKNLEKKVENISAGFKIAGAVLTGFASGGVALITKLTSAAASQEQADMLLAAAMKQVGKYSDEAFQHLKNYAGQLQRVTIYSDDSIESAQRMLLTFGAEGEMLDKLTKITLDFASAKGIDLKTASDLVAKSIGSSTNALSRYGIEITGAAGSTERMQMAVDEITRLFGGQAETMGKTFSGRIEIIKNRIDDLAESFGFALIPTLNKFIAIISNIITWFDNLTPSMKNLIAQFLLWGTALTGLSGTLFLIIGFLPSFLVGLTKLKPIIDILTSGIGGYALAIIAAYTAAKILVSVIDTWIGSFNELEAARAKEAASNIGLIKSLENQKKALETAWRNEKISQIEFLERTGKLDKLIKNLKATNDDTIISGMKGWKKWGWTVRDEADTTFNRIGKLSSNLYTVMRINIERSDAKYKELSESMKQNMATGFAAIMTGTRKLSDFWDIITDSMVVTFTQSTAKMVTDWIISTALMRQITLFLNDTLTTVWNDIVVMVIEKLGIMKVAMLAWRVVEEISSTALKVAWTTVWDNIVVMVLEKLGILKAATLAWGVVEWAVAKSIVAAKIVAGWATIPFVGVVLGISAAAAAISEMNSKFKFFAHGGMVTSPTLAMIGEGMNNPEVALPLSSPATIAALSKALSMAGGGKGGGEIINVSIGYLNNRRQAKDLGRLAGQGIMDELKKNRKI